MIRAEDGLQKEVAKFLTENMPLASWWTATANGAFLGGDKRRRMIQAARLKATGVKNGAPDIIFCHEGRFLSIELKMPKTKQSDSQILTEGQIRLAEGGYAVCRSVDEVSQQLAAWGVPIKGSLRDQLKASLLMGE